MDLSHLPAALTVRQVAEILQCEQHFVYRLIYERKLPAHRLGKRTWRIPKIGLERILESTTPLW